MNLIYLIIVASVQINIKWREVKFFFIHSVNNIHSICQSSSSSSSSWGSKYIEKNKKKNMNSNWNVIGIDVKKMNFFVCVYKCNNLRNVINKCRYIDFYYFYLWHYASIGYITRSKMIEKIISKWRHFTKQQACMTCCRSMRGKTKENHEKVMNMM